jgi:hypothetical protein
MRELVAYLAYCESVDEDSQNIDHSLLEGKKYYPRAADFD